MTYRHEKRHKLSADRFWRPTICRKKYVITAWLYHSKYTNKLPKLANKSKAGAKMSEIDKKSEIYEKILKLPQFLTNLPQTLSSRLHLFSCLHDKHSSFQFLYWKAVMVPPKYFSIGWLVCWLTSIHWASCLVKGLIDSL